MEKRPAVIVWFRRDLRLADNLALHAAMASKHPVICLYIREDGEDFAGALGAAQAWWLHRSLEALSGSLEKAGNKLVLRSGSAFDVLGELLEEYGCTHLFWNRRYDPDRIEQDADIKSRFQKQGVDVRSFDGFLLHEPSRLLTGEGKKYSVYTPFWKALDAHLQLMDPVGAPQEIPAPDKMPGSDNLDDWKLLPRNPDWARSFTPHWQPGEQGAKRALEKFIDNALKGYKSKRDYPGGNTTSRLSPHLAWGEISPHHVWRATLDLDDDIPTEDIIHFRKELVWREFSWHLLYHVHDLPIKNLNGKFDAFPWISDQAKFESWKRGRTGYPIVDAGMRELWQTGWMHNRVRMVVASFLIKDLMIDWREGETWFRDTLVDADKASNAASWQWVAGSGADAAPYFRVFNPIKQGETFDPEGAYIRQYCPELKRLPDQYIHRPFEAPNEVLGKAGVTLGENYPFPVVDHAERRKQALQAFAELGQT